MKTFIWSYLGLGEATQSNDKCTTRALPASWYRSENLYELERRAIFSKKWLLVTHKLRLKETGEWVRFEEAGFQFLLCRNRDGKIKGFHNICRHRGFPIVTEDKGRSQIFSCKYHGWSYSLNGQLTKAPGYHDMEGFDIGSNGLLPIHVHVDQQGFVWVNLDASQEPQVKWTDDFEGVDVQTRFESFNFDEYHFDHTWNMSGEYNWKTLADNYNECYHCPTAHPDAAAVADLKLYSVDTKGGHIQHFAHTKPEHEANGMKIASTFYFPNACMTVAPHFFYMMRCVPTSAHHCSMEYEVYRHKDASNEDFEKIDAMFKRILAEDKWLCTNVQRNLNAGVFVNGEMHPRMEKGPLYFQATVRRLLQAHHEREAAQKQEIWPAMQNPPSGACEKDMAFCSSVDEKHTSSAIEW